MNNLKLSLPEWTSLFLKEYTFPLNSQEQRMRFVLDLTLRNIEEETGGPFGAAVFEQYSGKLVSVGVNVVVRESCSAAHAEMMALMLAQKKLGNHDLSHPDLPIHQLVSSAKMCTMCLGNVIWSGIHEVLSSAQPEDVELITGFDEGPSPQNYDAQLKKRGISIISELLRKEGCAVLHRYVEKSGEIYNPTRTKSTLY